MESIVRVINILKTKNFERQTGTIQLKDKQSQKFRVVIRII